MRLSTKEELELNEVIYSIDSNIEILEKFNLIRANARDQLKDQYFEKFVLEPWEFKEGSIGGKFVRPNQIIGTHHASYYEKSMDKVLTTLDKKNKFKGVIYKYLINPDYYTDTSRKDSLMTLAYREKNKKYYIKSGNNNRILFSKIIGLEKVYIDEVVVFKEDIELKKLLESLNKLDFQFDEDLQNNEKIIFGDNLRLIFWSYESSKKLLRDFLDYFNNLKTSKLHEVLYKFQKSLRYRYEYKYEHDDEMKFIFHYNYLRLLNHKRKINYKL